MLNSIKYIILKKIVYLKETTIFNIDLYRVVDGCTSEAFYSAPNSRDDRISKIFRILRILLNVKYEANNNLIISTFGLHLSHC